MIAITGIYLIMGGYFAVTLTDFVQGIIMIGGAIVMVVILTDKANEILGGGSGFKAAFAGSPTVIASGWRRSRRKNSPACWGWGRWCL